jgi:cation diffusion facilitator CzcD-associated flavoprotein CzcO
MRIVLKINGKMLQNKHPYLVIVGAGPQALTLLTHILQKKEKWRDRVMVIDPSGEWMEQWRYQFAAQAIPHLRSPSVHHCDPNPYSLRKFAEKRPQELYAPYDLPGTELFNDFCQEVIKKWQLEKQVFPDQVTQITPLTTGFQLQLESGENIKTRKVVLATGGGKVNFPEWVRKINSDYPPHTLLHSQQIDLRKMVLTGQRILIVGGGLTSGHLALGAIAKNAITDLMTRREIQEKLFDADPGWLGPKYMKGFTAETIWQKRVEMIKKARNGGSMTPAMMLKLRRLQREGKLKIQENCQIQSATWSEGQWLVQCHNGVVHQYDQIWLATGSNFHGQSHPLLANLWEKYHTNLVEGLPILDEYLRIKGTELFIMGGLAALQLGPTARNLSGGIKASKLITSALIKQPVSKIN